MVMSLAVPPMPAAVRLPLLLASLAVNSPSLFVSNPAWPSPPCSVLSPFSSMCTFPSPLVDVQVLERHVCGLADFCVDGDGVGVRRSGDRRGIVWNINLRSLCNGLSAALGVDRNISVRDVPVPGEDRRKLTCRQQKSAER